LNQMSDARSPRPLRLSIVATLLLLTLQGWLGDFVNVFVTTSSTSSVSFSDFTQALVNQGSAVVVHALVGFLVFFSGIGVLVVSLRYSDRRVKIAASLALLAVVSAGVGGILFVLSGFSDGGSSMQMGGSFIAAYALYFITLYYSK
jgi:heme A synthase